MVVSLDKQSPPSPSTTSDAWDKPISRQTTTATAMDQWTLFTLASKTELAFAAFRKGFLSLALQMSPLFWLAFILRLKCLTSFFEGHLCKTFLPPTTIDDNNGDHDHDHDEDHDGHRWISMLIPSRSVLFRLSFVIGFTTVLMQHFTTNSWYLLARYQWVVRTLQTYSAPVFYALACKAFHHEDWDHDDDDGGLGFW